MWFVIYSSFEILSFVVVFPCFWNDVLIMSVCLLRIGSKYLRSIILTIWLRRACLAARVYQYYLLRHSCNDIWFATSMEAIFLAVDVNFVTSAVSWIWNKPGSVGRINWDVFDIWSYVSVFRTNAKYPSCPPHNVVAMHWAFLLICLMTCLIVCKFLIAYYRCKCCILKLVNVICDRLTRFCHCSLVIWP